MQPNGSEGNRHHNLPRSVGGATNGYNITHLGLDKHNAFHHFAGHPSPCHFVRLLVMRSLGAEKKLIAPNAAQDLLGLVMEQDWRDHYRREALRVVEGRDEHERYLATTSFHLSRQVLQELTSTVNAVGLLGMGQWVPMDERNFVAQAKHHFGAACVPLALRGFLTAETRGGDLKYAKCLKPRVRSDLLDVLRHAKPEQADDRDKAALLRIIERHHRMLLMRATQWKPDLGVLITHANYVALPENGTAPRDRKVQV